MCVGEGGGKSRVKCTFRMTTVLHIHVLAYNQMNGLSSTVHTALHTLVQYYTYYYLLHGNIMFINARYDDDIFHLQYLQRRCEWARCLFSY